MSFTEGWWSRAFDNGKCASRRAGLTGNICDEIDVCVAFATVDGRLATREFFADAISIADFAILGWVWRHPRHKVDLKDFPHVERWYNTLMARPAVKRGFAVPLS